MHIKNYNTNRRAEHAKMEIGKELYQSTEDKITTSAGMWYARREIEKDFWEEMRLTGPCHLGKWLGEQKEKSTDEGKNMDAGDFSWEPAWSTIILPVPRNYNTQTSNLPGIIHSSQLGRSHSPPRSLWILHWEIESLGGGVRILLVKLLKLPRFIFLRPSSLSFPWIPWVP